MKILLSGYYGFGNVGDESVLQAIIQGLRDTDPKMEITVLSASPNLTRELHQVNSIYRYDWLKILAKLLRTDIFVSGGGTLFQNITSNRSFLYYIGLILVAKLFWKKVAIFAQGFGPLKGRFYRLLARFVINRVNLITLRDQNSYDEIQKLGIRRPKTYVTADPSAILKAPSSEIGLKILGLEAIRIGRPLLGVAVRNLPQKEEERLYKSLSETIDWLSKSYSYSPVFILFQCPEDMGATSKVINYMQEKSNIIFRMCRPDEMLALISSFDLLIGMRLHSLIFAAMNSVPMLGISYDPKVEAFMQSIEQPHFKIDQNFDFLSLNATLQSILANKEKIRAGLEARKKELRDRAATNFDLFFEEFKLK